MVSSATSHNLAYLDLATAAMPKSSSSLAYLDLAVCAVHTAETPEPPASSSRIIRVAKRAFAWIKNFYTNQVAPIVDRIDWSGKVVYETGRLGGYLYAFISEVVLPILGFVRNTSEAANGAIPEGSPYMVWIRRAKVLCVVTIPISVFDIAIETYNICKALFGQRDWSSAGDSALVIVQDVSDITDAVGMVLAGVQEFGVLAHSGVSIAASSLWGVSTALSVASIALNLKHAIEGVVFYKKLRSQFSGSKDFHAVVEHIQTKGANSLKRNLGVGDAGKFKDRMNTIWERNQDGSEQSRSNIKKVMNAFKWHTYLKTMNHSLSMIAGAISVVALPVLVFTPYAPIGYAMYATAAAIGLYVLISGKISTYCFERTIKKLTAGVDLSKWPEPSPTPVQENSFQHIIDWVPKPWQPQLAV